MNPYVKMCVRCEIESRARLNRSNILHFVAWKRPNRGVDVSLSAIGNIEPHYKSLKQAEIDIGMRIMEVHSAYIIKVPKQFVTFISGRRMRFFASVSFLFAYCALF